MEQREYEIFSKNLSNLVAESGRTQLEISKAIGVSAPTFNMWLKGKALPRMDKVQKLADYFGVDKSALIEDKANQPEESSTIRMLNFEIKEMSESQQKRLLEYVRLLKIMNKGGDN